MRLEIYSLRPGNFQDSVYELTSLEISETLQSAWTNFLANFQAVALDGLKINK